MDHLKPVTGAVLAAGGAAHPSWAEQLNPWMEFASYAVAIAAGIATIAWIVKQWRTSAKSTTES